jgi:hypothetical protein
MLYHSKHGNRLVHANEPLLHVKTVYTEPFTRNIRYIHDDMTECAHIRRTYPW